MKNKRLNGLRLCSVSVIIAAFLFAGCFTPENGQAEPESQEAALYQPAEILPQSRSQDSIDVGKNQDIPNPQDIPNSQDIPDSQNPEIKEPGSQGDSAIPDESLAAVPSGPEISKLPRAAVSWYFNPNKEHLPPTAQEQIDLAQYNACYLGDTAEKVIYLTFDQGYENGYTDDILDTLKEKNVPAAFFLLDSYLSMNEELVLRMQAEGHVVGNHSVNHYSLPELSEEEIREEITGIENKYQELTKVPMDKFFRPPEGKYSEQVLGIASELGYKTVFWSFAYADWDVNNQPGKEAAMAIIEERYHNGGIMLLHSVSSSNAEALADVIDMLHEAGYAFGSLKDLP